MTVAIRVEASREAVGLLADQAQLARVGRSSGHLTRGLDIVVRWIEFTDELVQPQGRFPDVKQKMTPRTAALDAAAAVDSGVIALMPRATPIESAGADLQLVYCIPRYDSISRYNPQ